MTKSKNKKTLTDKQLAANQANAQNSTGGKTPAGKMKQKFNALDHGARAQHVVLPDEDPVEYRDHCLIFLRGYVPQDPLEFQLVCRIAEEEWRIQRVVSVETSVYHTAVCRDDLASELLKFSMYESRIDREVCRTERRLFKLQDLRRAGKRDYLDENPSQPPKFHLTDLDTPMSDVEMLPKARLEGEKLQRHLLDVFQANQAVPDAENPLLQQGIAIKKGETEDWLKQQGIGIFEPCATVTPQPLNEDKTNTPDVKAIVEEPEAILSEEDQVRQQAHLDDVAIGIDGPEANPAPKKNSPEKMGSFVTFCNNTSETECKESSKSTDNIEGTDNLTVLPENQASEPSDETTSPPKMGSFVIFYQKAKKIFETKASETPHNDSSGEEAGYD